MIKSILAGAIASCAAFSAAGAEEFTKTNLKFAHFLPQVVTQSKVDEWWANELNERSGGQIEVNFFWSQSLAKANEILQLVAAGGVQAGSTAPAFYPAELPLISATQLPLVFPDTASVHKATTAVLGVPEALAENHNANVVPVMWHSIAPYRLLCTKPIRTMADFEGAKLRSYGQYVPQMWDSLGAVPVNIAPSEIYEGLQRGLIDCAYLSDDTHLGFGLHEVAKYYIDINFGAIAGLPIWINKDQWDAWPEAQKQLFVEVGKEAADRDRDQVASSSVSSQEAILASGVELVRFEELDTFQTTVPNFLTLWQSDMAERGLAQPAEAVAEAISAHAQM